MALTQMQIIQSLGEAMSWFERELNWQVQPTELRHLCGRIGELYAALITNGQMALETNQNGYDVVSAEGEKISVKTTAKMDSSGHVSFNSNTLDKVDRIIILRLNTEEMQIETLFNNTVESARTLMTPDRDGKQTIALSKLLKSSKPASELKTVNHAQHQGYEIHELESGTIEIKKDGRVISPVKPVLREIAMELGVNIINGSGNPLNTRQLGNNIIKALAKFDQS